MNDIDFYEADELLKECPFCGGDANLKSNYSERLDLYFFFAKCGVCGAQGRSVTDESQAPVRRAINAWNIRVKKAQK